MHPRAVCLRLRDVKVLRTGTDEKCDFARHTNPDNAPVHALGLPNVVMFDPSALASDTIRLLCGTLAYFK